MIDQVDNNLDKFKPKILKSPIADFDVILFKHPVINGFKTSGVPNSPLPPFVSYSDEISVFAGKKAYQVSEDFPFCRKRLIQFYFNCSVTMHFEFNGSTGNAKFQSASIIDQLLKQSVNGVVDVSKLFYPSHKKIEYECESDGVFVCLHFQRSNSTRAFPIKYADLLTSKLPSSISLSDNEFMIAVGEVIIDGIKQGIDDFSFISPRQDISNHFSESSGVLKIGI